MSTTPLKDLIFELSDVGQPKICIAVCDSVEERKRLTENILAELDKENIKTSLSKFDSSQTDLVAKLQEHRRSHKTEAVIVDGLESLNEKSVELVLAKLNFRRDILASLNVSLLLWVTNSLLQQLVACAPDFWSRRTATYFFNRVEMKEHLKKIFGQEIVTDVQAFANRKISRALRTVLSNEAELNKLLEASKHISPIKLDKLIRAISMGVESLIHGSNEGKGTLITMNLWNLADMDKLIRNFKRSRVSGFGDLDDFYTNVFLQASQRIANILMNYKEKLLKNASKHRAVNLVLDFATIALNSARNGMIIERWRDLVGIHDVNDEILSPEAGIVQNFEELSSWLNNENAQLPSSFSETEGRLLRILCNESKNAATVAKKMKISEAQAKRKIAELKEKVHALLGMA